MKIIEGKAVQGGIAVGSIMKLRERPTVEKRTVSQPEKELERLRDALQRISDDMAKRQRTAAPAAAGILAAQQALLTDESLRRAMEDAIREEKINAEYAAVSCGERLAKEFSEMEDAYLRARAEDVRQVTGAVADALTGFSDAVAPTEPVILAAEAFTPAQLSVMDRSMVLGLAAHTGSPASHTAILAANLGLPYLIRVDIGALKDGAAAVLDGDAGELVLEPDEQTLKSAKERLAKQKRLIETAPAETRMKVYANISSAEDAREAAQMHADGVGLFRTEFLYMNRPSAPDEEEQYHVYRDVLTAMDGKEVIIRTLDAGTDKPVPYLGMPKEENPALGLRGVRVSLWKPDEFRVQLRALLRAARHGNLGVMFPMICGLTEIKAIREQLALAKEELQKRKESYAMPRIGVMIETPAAALVSEALSREVDFFSIGTNDLTQYTLALDRQAEGMEQYYEPHHEAIYALIEMTARAGIKRGIPVGVCGQLGADLKALERFSAMGLTEVSVAPTAIPAVRGRIAEIEAASGTPETPDMPEDEEIGAPADGVLIPMEQIPDETFAQGLLGQCFGIEPENGAVCAPVSGTVTTIAETCHAIGLHSDGGRDILLHIGIDTVTLKGRGFTPKTAVGAHVKKGETLMEADLSVIREAGLDPMVITVLL